MTIRAILAKLNDRLFRARALREARAAVISQGGSRDRALRQARLLVEVARRVAEPVEALPPGSRPAVLLALYRDAVYWALVSGHQGEGEARADLATLWAEYPAEGILHAARDGATMDAVRSALVDGSPRGSLEATEVDAGRAGAFAEALVSDLEAPRRRVQRILAQRWSRIAVVGVAAVLLGFGAHRLSLGPNLAAGKPIRTSSTWAGCPSDPNCVGLLFCTDNETNPWAEIDLGAPRTFHRIEATNRGDCCADRAIPLLVEVSRDRMSWTEVARRETDFSSWTAKFQRKTARYVRFRVPKATVFHLQDVAIR
jgi:hypothetical protein